MTKYFCIAVIVVLLASCAFAQEDGVINPTPDRVVAGPQGPTGPQGPAGPAGATGATGPAGKAGKTVFRTFREYHAAKEAGGAAAKYAKPVVDEALQRGQYNGGLAGRRKGAKSSDKEWRSHVERQEFAIGMVRGAKFSEWLVKQHNSEGNELAHPDLRRATRQIPWIWVVLGVVAVIAICGLFFPRLRMPCPGGYGY